MPKPRQNSSKRCEEIVRAARKLIVEKGFEGLRTRDIAAEVGINISTLHYHIPTKHDLVKLVIQSLQDDIEKHWSDKPENKTDIPKRMKYSLSLHWMFHELHPDARGLLHEFHSLATRDEKVKTIMRDMQTGWMNKFTILLEEGKEQGTLRQNLDSAAFAGIFLFTITSFWRLPDCNKEKFDQICDELIRSVTN